jgi:hypothetical protein
MPATKNFTATSTEWDPKSRLRSRYVAKKIRLLRLLTEELQVRGSSPTISQN